MRRPTITALLVLAAALFMVVPATRALAAVPNLGKAADYAVLGLNNGTVIINSSKSLLGNVGYSAGVVSTTNQKVDVFTGAAYVHSTATFSYTPATFAPSGGIHYGSSEPIVDSNLNQANADAIAASAAAAAMAPTHTLGVLGDGDSRTVVSTGPVNVVSITSLDYNSDQIDFVSRPGFQDYFVVNVSGNFAFSQSTVNLVGTDAARILWNFPNASSIDLNKSANIFKGTILAPTGTVIYHNPASFEGAIVALNINLHSDFNLAYRRFGDGPTPARSATWGQIKAAYR